MEALDYAVKLLKTPLQNPEATAFIFALAWISGVAKMPSRTASASGSVSMSLNGEPWRRSGRSWPSIPVENRHATWLRHLSPPVKISGVGREEVEE